MLDLPDGELAYTARTGRVVLREEVYENDVFTGWKPRAEMAVTAYTLDGGDVTERPVCFVFNGGPGSASVWLHLGLLGPRRVDMGDVGDLVPPPYGHGRQRRDAAARRRPGLHRPDVDRAHARRRGRQGEGLPRLRQGRGAGRRADPALVHPRGPLDVAEVPDRRVLRHGPRGRRGRAALEHPHDGLQRPGAGLERARLRLPGLQLPPQRRGVRQLPADLRRDRPLPRPARGALARARS